MKRTTALPLLVLTAVLALVLGSLGTATAAGLTKGAVKKIATKVVKKQAPQLSVAHAASAGTATTLAGQPATAFQTNATVYTTDVTTGTTGFAITVPLASGKYLLSYSVFLQSPTAADCYIRKSVGAIDTFVGEESTDATTYDPGLSGTAFIDVVPGMVVKLQCSSAGSSTTASSEPIQIIVQKVDNAAVATLAPAKAGPDSRQH